MKRDKKAVVVGAGLTGCVMARLLAEKGYSVDLFEQEREIGGLCHDFYLKGVLCPSYGAHYFRTDSKRVIDFLSKFTSWKKFTPIIKSCIGHKLYDFPINLNTLSQVFMKDMTKLEAENLLGILKEKKDTKELNTKSKLGGFLYSLFYEGYSKKQWGEYYNDISEEVLKRIRISLDKNENYLDEGFQAMPSGGYILMLKNMIAHKNINIYHNKFASVETTLFDFDKYSLVIWTGKIDEYFNHNHGNLPYRSTRYEFKEYDKLKVMQVCQVNYPEENIAFTRRIEPSQYNHSKSKKSIVITEYPCSFGTPMYPIPTIKTNKILERYKKLAKKEKRVIFLGRLGNYAYLNMDEAVLRCLEAGDKIKQVK